MIELILKSFAIIFSVTLHSLHVHFSQFSEKTMRHIRIERERDGIMDMVEIAFSLVFSKLIKLNLIIMVSHFAAAALSSLFMLKIALVANDEDNIM